MLSDESDFKNLIDEELVSSSKSIKVHIVSLEGLRHSQVQPIVNDSMSISNEEFHVIKKEGSPKASSTVLVLKPNNQAKPQVSLKIKRTNKYQTNQLIIT